MRSDRDFTYVDEVVDGLVATLDVALPTPDGVATFNLGSGRPVAAAELLEAVAGVTGRRPDVAFGPPRPGEPTSTWADPSAARRHLGLAPPRPLLEGLSRQLDGPDTPIA